MIVLYSNKVNLANGLCQVSLLQHHIKATFDNTFDNGLYSDLNHPLMKKRRCLLIVLAKVQLCSIDLNSTCISSYKKDSYYIIVVLVLYNEIQCTKRIILNSIIFVCGSFWYLCLKHDSLSDARNKSYDRLKISSAEVEKRTRVRN